MTTANDLKSPRGALNSLNRLLNDSRTALSPDAPYSPPAIPPGSPRYTAFPRLPLTYTVKVPATAPHAPPAAPTRLIGPALAVES